MQDLSLSKYTPSCLRNYFIFPIFLDFFHLKFDFSYGKSLTYIYGIFGTKKVESFCYSRNILQWSKNDIKSNKSTNGDYL